jgi:hypothetical protein
MSIFYDIIIRSPKDNFENVRCVRKCDICARSVNTGFRVRKIIRNSFL